MAAVGNGFVDCANLLLGEGANLLALDMYQRGALHRAVSNSDKSMRDVINFVISVSCCWNTGDLPICLFKVQVTDGSFSYKMIN